MPTPTESNQPQIASSEVFHPKATHVVETLLSSTANDIATTTNDTKENSVKTDTPTTHHAFNLLEHELKNPLAAIQTNQELLLEQLEFLDHQDQQGFILQSLDDNRRYKLCQVLAFALNTTQYSLKSLASIGEIFKQVRQATGLLSKQPNTPSVEQAFNSLEQGLKDPISTIQNNEALVLEQLTLLTQEALEGRLVTTANYQGKVPIDKLLSVMTALSSHSLKSLHHIGEVFTNVRQLTGLFRKQDNTVLKPTYKTVRLKKLALQALEQCLNQYPTIQTKIDCTLDERTSIMGNESLLKQAFLNIIQNGYEVLAEYQPTTPCLTVRLHEVIKPFKAVTIEIHNNGPVIPPALITQIFEPYVSTKAKNTPEGNQGLGLAIAKQAIEAHRGKLVCKSKELEGTTFFVLLKL